MQRHFARLSFPAWRALCAAFVAAALALGCGGGVGTGGTGSFTSSFSVGPITGLGSIFVNGVRYDTSSSSLSVVDEDGSSRSSSELDLGMTVRVDGSGIDSSSGSPVATASRVVTSSELLGAVQAPPTTVGTVTSFTMVGSVVRIDGGTVLDNRLGGLAGLTAGRVVEVYGAFDVTRQAFVATRIEPQRAGSGIATVFRVRGPVSALNTTARTFQIGSAVFTYTTAPAGLADGAILRLSVATTADAQGRWSVNSASAGVPSLPDTDEAEIKGRITQFSSPSSFSVNGIPVNATGVTAIGGTLAQGVRVEVEGALTGGVLNALKVKVEAEESDSGGGATELEFEGLVGTVNTLNKTFTMKGKTQAISYARSDLRIEPVGKTVNDLVPEAKVHVKGVLAADRSTVEATRLKFED